jgi:hypothetical protein
MKAEKGLDEEEEKRNNKLSTKGLCNLFFAFALLHQKLYSESFG